MSTCNRLDLQTLGSQLVMLKNLPDHCTYIHISNDPFPLDFTKYMLFGQLSEKADVYSFGVLVLEIMSGKRNIDLTTTEEDVYLPNRVSFSNSNVCMVHLAQCF